MRSSSAFFRHAGQFVARRPRDPVQAATNLQQLVRHLQRADTVTAAAEHNRQQLIVPHGDRAMTQQLLARAIVGREISHVYSKGGDGSCEADSRGMSGRVRGRFMRAAP